jgi:hypothetical protein
MPQRPDNVILSYQRVKVGRSEFACQYLVTHDAAL